MPDQQWGPPTGPYPQPGTPGGHYPPPSGPAQQPYQGQQQNPYQTGFQGGYRQPPQGYPQAGFPPQNPGFGWGPQFGGPPPRKPNRTGLYVVLGLLGVAVVAVAVIGGLAARGGDDIPVSDDPSPVVTSPTLPTPEPTQTDATPPTSVSPTTTQPTTTQPTRTKPTPPPHKPKPRKPTPSDRDIVTRDKFYATGSLPSVGCRLSGARPSNKAGIQAYYNTVFRCLNANWAPKIRRAGDTFRAPRVLLVAGPVSGPCGGGFSSVSYYCGQNEVIYMRYDLDVKQYNKYPENYQKVFAKMWALFTVAHEYGHHVQQLSGIMTASWNRTYQFDSEYARLEESRRRELQASCLSAVFIGANRNALPMTGENKRQYLWAVSHTIDPRRDHGNPNNHWFWSKRGFFGRNPNLCNTFTSSGTLVS